MSPQTEYEKQLERELAELRKDKERLDWLLDTRNGVVKYGKLSPIDEAYDEKILVKSREDIDAERQDIKT